MTADLVARLEEACRTPAGNELPDHAEPWGVDVALLREAASALRSSGEAVATVCLVGERYAHGNLIEVQLQLASADSPTPKVGERYYLHPATPANAWRPIAEAPLDESLLLLGWNNGNPPNGAHIVIGSNWHGRWVDRGMDEANRDLGNTLAYIEYFQPLPTPPTSTKA